MAGHTLPQQFEYDGVLLSGVSSSVEMIEGVRKMTLAPADVLVAAYSKSGTTWMTYLTHLVLNDGDDKGSGVGFRKSDIRFLEFNFLGESASEILQLFKDKPSPRLFSTHLHFRFLQSHVVEDKVKVILVLRNPKDTLVSFFHFYRMNRAMGSYTGTWDEFFQLFKEKRLWGGDFFDFNTEWWKAKAHNSNILAVTYEEMIRDLDGVVRKVAKFTQSNLSDDVIRKIVHATSFAQMKDNPRVNGSEAKNKGVFNFQTSEFIRKGVIGDWKNYFTEEQSRYVDKLCEEKCAPLGLTFNR